LETIPNGKLLEGLKTARGKGRDDHLVRTLAGSAVPTPALRHTSFEVCLGELRRNPSRATLNDIQSGKKIPRSWSVSRFLASLGQGGHRAELEAVFKAMVKRQK
jgi:hypothetical protein